MAHIMEREVQVVWYKRDLRVHDSPVLRAAAQHGSVLPLYIVEPSLVHARDFDPAHWTFLQHSLEALRTELASLGQPLVVRVGEVIDVLEALSQEISFGTLWSHEETGNWQTYQRDLAVAKWAKARRLPWHELPQTGVVRRLKSRNGWAGAWEQYMRAPLAATPRRILPVSEIDLGPIPSHRDLGLNPSTRREMHPGGEQEARHLLASFLSERGAGYQRAMSSPLSAWETCSRLSTHLAWGIISLRSVYQSVLRRQDVLRQMEAGERDELAGPRLKDLNAFASRLHWRSHFMQKLEDEPRIEFENFNHAYDGLREDDFNRDWFEAWCAGRTGYPLVDACMRAVCATGYLNFRMRAMLVSFASYDLWLHWREPGVFLARQWLDYEPGIHYSQMQMQSGTTGINTVRVYDPTKQAHEQDPDGQFIRRWVPELAAVPQAYIHEPWHMPTEVQRKRSCLLGRDYPLPIVDHASTVRLSRSRIAALRRESATQEQARAVLIRHGSRKDARRRLKTLHPGEAQQLPLGLPFADERLEEEDTN